MNLDFAKQNGLIPAIVQDADTQKVLMLGYMNREAYRKTVEDGRVTFWSRSRKTLWTKGETSGHYLTLKEILIDCDGDTLLIKATPHGPVCHTGNDTCFAEQNRSALPFLEKLETVIDERRNQPVAKSYVAGLFKKGLMRITQKVGEEATETVIEALAGSRERFISESADLLFHLLVLLRARSVSINEVANELKIRHRLKTEQNK